MNRTAGPRAPRIAGLTRGQGDAEGFGPARGCRAWPVGGLSHGTC
jgi:hypothetical protein